MNYPSVWDTQGLRKPQVLFSYMNKSNIFVFSLRLFCYVYARLADLGGGWERWRDPILLEHQLFKVNWGCFIDSWIWGVSNFPPSFEHISSWLSKLLKMDRADSLLSRTCETISRNYMLVSQVIGVPYHQVNQSSLVINQPELWGLPTLRNPHIDGGMFLTVLSPWFFESLNQLKWFAHTVHQLISSPLIRSD